MSRAFLLVSWLALSGCVSPTLVAGVRYPVCPADAPCSRNAVRAGERYTVFLETAYVSSAAAPNAYQRMLGSDLIFDISRPSGVQLGADFRWIHTVSRMGNDGRVPISRLPVLYDMVANNGLYLQLAVHRTSERQTQEVRQSIEPIVELVGVTSALADVSRFLPLLNKLADGVGLGKELPVLQITFSAPAPIGAADCNNNDLCDGFFVVLDSQASDQPHDLRYNVARQRVEQAAINDAWEPVEATYLVFQIRVGAPVTAAVASRAQALFSRMYNRAQASDVDQASGLLTAVLPDADIDPIIRLSRAYSYFQTATTADGLPQEAFVRQSDLIHQAYSDLNTPRMPSVLRASSYADSANLCEAVRRVCVTVHRAERRLRCIESSEGQHDAVSCEGVDVPSPRLCQSVETECTVQ